MAVKISNIWRVKIAMKDMEKQGYEIMKCCDHRKPYYDFIAHIRNSQSLFVDAQDRNFSPRELQKFKELAEHTNGRAVKAHIKHFLGFFGLKVEYTIL